MSLVRAIIHRLGETPRGSKAAVINEGAAVNHLAGDAFGRVNGLARFDRVIETYYQNTD